MKKSKIIVPALGILVLSTAASITGTVAWFSANTNVTVTGMSVTTKTSDNIYIAANNVESEFGAALTQGRTGILEPTSTIDGLSYYYAIDGKANGASAAGAFTAYAENTASENAGAAGKSKYDSAFNGAYGGADGVGTLMYGYIDYSFYLKAVNSSASNTAYINMTSCNLRYNGNAVTEKAWRVAMFVSSTTQGTTVADGTLFAAGNRKTILALDGAANQESGKAVSGANAKAAVTYGTAANVGNVSASSSAYFKVAVRLWLEGEDTTCTTETFASLTSAYTLDLGFSIATATGGLQLIESTNAA